MVVFPPNSDSALELVEVGVESVGLTVVVTEALKPLVGRERPNTIWPRRARERVESLAHPATASAMAGAAVGLVARAEQLPVPAKSRSMAALIHTAFTRVENDKHFRRTSPRRSSAASCEHDLMLRTMDATAQGF